MSNAFGGILPEGFPKLASTPPRGATAGRNKQQAGGFALFLTGMATAAVAISILCSPVQGRPDETFLGALRAGAGEQPSAGSVELSQLEMDRIRVTAQVVAKQRKNSAAHGMYHRLVDDDTLMLHPLDVLGEKMAGRAGQEGAQEGQAATAGAEGEGAEGGGAEGEPGQQFEERMLQLRKHMQDENQAGEAAPSAS